MDRCCVHVHVECTLIGLDANSRERKGSKAGWFMTQARWWRMLHILSPCFHYSRSTCHTCRVFSTMLKYPTRKRSGLQTMECCCQILCSLTAIYCSLLPYHAMFLRLTYFFVHPYVYVQDGALEITVSGEKYRCLRFAKAKK